jgi:aspartate racemase
METRQTSDRDAVIGLVGGLGVGAAIHYYREFAAAHDDGRQPMQLVMAHASVARVAAYAAAGDRQGLADYLAAFLARLERAGATIGVVPAVTPHLCIDELTAITPIPVIDITKVVSDHLHERKLSRVALFGTRFVVESSMYGRLPGFEVVRPHDEEIDFIHAAYSELAKTGLVSAADRQHFISLADRLRTRDGVEAVLLAGTDLALMFDASNTPFPYVDCARVHINAILQVLRSPSLR